MPTDFLRYCRLVFYAAWGHSASLARTIIFYAVVIIGAATFLVPTIGMTINAAGLLSLLSNPKFYAGLFGAIVLSRLLCAPYWIWQDDQTKIAALRKDPNAARQRRNKNVAKLHEFYVAVGPIIDRSLPKDISETDFKKYEEEANTWAMNCANWIEQNMGAAAVARFLDRTYMLGIHPPGAVNATHTNIIRSLSKWSQNLLALIESDDSWDVNRE
jgi:hypothetical protein